MEKLVVFGTSEITEIADFYFKFHEIADVAAFTVDDDYCKESSFCGKPLVPFSEVAKKFSPESHKGFVAISYAKMNKIREQKYVDMKEAGYELISYVSPKCSNYAKSIGDNCFIFEDNTIQPFVTIGNNVTLWSGNHIGHHSHIGDNNFISSHVVISGGVTVEPNCFLGVNATLRDHITIGRECLIAAGALITKDCEPYGVYKGSNKMSRHKVPTTEIEKI
jgi:sugar O-acyltransferase (sialic acid O-acetyltransferase NeuD family)